MTDNGKKNPVIFEAIDLGGFNIEIKIRTNNIPKLLCALKLMELQIENKVIGMTTPPAPMVQTVQIPPSLRRIIEGNN